MLRDLPRVDEVLRHPLLTQAAPRALARQAVRQAIGEARSRLKSGGAPDLSADAIAARAAQVVRDLLTPSLRRAVNATGVVLHTGLGRAPLSDAAREALNEVAAGYCNVQADLESGQRTERESHVQPLLEALTGAPCALVVNNNAAATVLVLNTLAAGREVILSRGEMVEIGGAFRIPEIMALAGCRLVEVGCTNRTHLRDYEQAVGDRTALILSVHQSNYRIVGFTSQVPVADLARLARARNLVCAHDLGSGALLDLRELGLPHEPSAPESLAAGADVVLFSGDKLLGGPQCGIILGRSDLLETMRGNPYYRAFRVCKLTLAALEATLRLLLDPETLVERHRLLSLLTRPVEEIRSQAQALADRIAAACGPWLDAQPADGESAVGGGSLAGRSLPTVVVRLRPTGLTAGELAHRLRRHDPPVFARVHDQTVLLDPRTVLAGEDEVVVAALEAIGRAR